MPSKNKDLNSKQKNMVELVVVEKEDEAKLIPKPEGQAGSRDGYHLREAMGIEPKRFNGLLRIVGHYASIHLDTRLSFDDQDERLLSSAIQEISDTNKMFQRFEDLWPIKEMIKHYFSNAAKTLAKDLRDEANTNAEDSKDRDKEATTDIDTHNEAETLKPTARTVKRKPVTAADEQSPPKKPRVQVRLKQPEKKNCPSVCCSDLIPSSPSDSLKSLLSRLDNAKRKGITSGINFIALEICVAIKRDGRSLELQELGARLNWPSPINFESLPDRVSGLEKKIRPLLANEIVLSCSPSFVAFAKNIQQNNLNFGEFRTQTDLKKFSIAGSNKHAGYYGPIGVAVIISTLVRLFGSESDSDELASTLADLLSNKWSENHKDADRAFWACSDPSTTGDLLKKQEFLEYILLPHTVELLISQDLGVDESEAGEIRLKSEDYGIVLYSDTDNDCVDDIITKNTYLATKPARLRRKTSMSRSNATPGPGPSTLASRAAKGNTLKSK